MKNAAGLCLIDKPVGLTSFQALSSLKRTLQTGRIGHCGTLDRFASGLLLVLAGRLTTLVAHLTALDKVYEARIRFGEETDTLDPEGEIVERGPLPSLAAVEAALPAFLGRVMQAPPAYSAIHINGKRASERSRSGEALEMKKRPVVIHSLETTFWEPPFFGLRVHCGKGTYIRSIARDLALAVGSRAHLVALRRTSIGPFRVEDAVEPLGFSQDKLLVDAAGFASVPGFYSMKIQDDRLPDLRQGREISNAWFQEQPPQDGTVVLCGEDGSILGALSRTDGKWGYIAVL